MVESGTQFMKHPVFDLIPGMTVIFSDGGPRGRVGKVTVFQRS